MDDRADSPRTGSERETLAGFLDYQRATLARKCAGLGADQLRERAVPPSNLSLLGLVRHVTDVEAGWFRHGVNGEVRTSHYASADEPDADFLDADGADVEEAFAAWRDECARARDIVAGHSLDHTFSNRNGTEISLRWVLVHMIEEYARHNGHADLLRQRIDGATGE